MQCNVLQSEVKRAIKKMYAQLVSITGYASPCKWGIFHMNIKLGQEKIIFHIDKKLGHVNTHETEFKAGH